MATSKRQDAEELGNEDKSYSNNLEYAPGTLPAGTHKDGELIRSCMLTDAYCEFRHTTGLP